MSRSSRKRKKKLSPPVKAIRTLVILALAASILQYLQTGTVTWPAELYRKVVATVTDYPTRPSAGWRKAGDELGRIGAQREGQPAPEFQLTGRVVKIMDGDSFSLLDKSNRQHTIRMFGIDTPEWDQPHGDRAKRALASLVDGRQVGVVEVDTDTFGRTVGTVFLGDTNVNLAMVEAGHAWWFARYAPYERHLASAEESAREAGIGLWAMENPVPPWRWRREQRR